MKKIDGIRDLKSVELQEVNGGFWPVVVGILGFAYWCADNHDAIYEGYMEGVK